MNDCERFLQAVRMNAHAIEVIRDLLVESRMGRARHPVESFFYQVVDRKSQFGFEGMLSGDAGSKVFLCNGGDPEISIENRHDAEADMHLAPEHPCYQMDRRIRLDADARKVGPRCLLPLEEGQDLLMDIEGVPDVQGPTAFDRGIDRVVETALDVLDGFADLPNGRLALFGEFKTLEGSLEEFNAPALLERSYLPTHVGVADVEARSRSEQTALFRKNEGAQ